MFDNNDFEIDSRSSSAYTSLEKYTLKTFVMMALGLLVTTITAVLMNINYFSMRLFVSFPAITYILLFAELGVVVAFSARLFKASLTSTRIMFFAYAILTGITFSVLQYAFNAMTIYIAFGITCVYFGSLCVIGFTTKMNLAKIAPILFAGLLCLIIFNVVGMFINLARWDMLVCSIGLILFTGITAYDAQKMKRLYLQYQGNEDMLSRLSMYSALELYLDFINIFLYILRILGNKRN